MARIFLADDDQGILDATTLALELAGHQVRATTRGQTVIEDTTWDPDVYILDVSMSGCDGCEVTRQLRQITDQQDIPVLLFSARRDLAQLASAVQATDFLAKPFDIDQLLDKVNACLQRVTLSRSATSMH